MLSLEELGNPTAQARECRLAFIKALTDKANALTQLASLFEQINEKELDADQYYHIKEQIGYYLADYSHIMDMNDIVRKGFAYQNRATELYFRTIAKENNK